MASSPPTEPLVQLLAGAIVAQARRQVQESSDPGSDTTEAANASKTPSQRNRDAS